MKTLLDEVMANLFQIPRSTHFLPLHLPRYILPCVLGSCVVIDTPVFALAELLSRALSLFH